MASLALEGVVTLVKCFESSKFLTEEYALKLVESSLYYLFAIFHFDFICRPIIVRHSLLPISERSVASQI
jgi:hypothetical protein